MLKPRTVMVVGSFAQCSLAVLAISAVAVGLFVAVGCFVEGICAGVESERVE